MVNAFRYEINNDMKLTNHLCRISHPHNTHSMRYGQIQLQGGGWKYHIKYKGQDWFTSFLRIQHTCRCQMAGIALWQAYQATTVS